MNRTPLVFLGIFFTLAFSWTGLVLTNQISYGALRPFVDEGDNKAFPESMSGVAAQGKLVYEDLGCISCHTQQVRRPGFGTDDKRHWGERQSVGRDYVRESRVLLGSSRLGPDLRNVGARQTGDEGRAWHYKHLYDAQLTSPGSNMPSYPFLFETRKAVGQYSAKSIQKWLSPSQQPPAGFEIVPTHRGEALVEYLLSLKDTFNYPDEAARVYTPPKAEGAGAAKKPEAKPEGHK